MTSASASSRPTGPAKACCNATRSRFNIALPWLHSFSSWSFLRRLKLGTAIDDRAHELALSTDDYTRLVSVLSGGNQQKVVIAKWLLESPGR